MGKELIKYRGKTFELNEHGNNTAIKCHILDDDLMRLAKFTDLSDDRWYYCRFLRPVSNDISFNLAIDKKDPSKWSIDILDEDFLQPYDYQWMIKRELEGEKFDGDFHWQINEIVELTMEHLVRLGIISGWERGDYI